MPQYSSVFIADALAQLQIGKLTATQLLESCLEQVARRDRDVRAWAAIDERSARARACELDEARARGEPLGRLHGIPIGVKDVVNVRGFVTLAGCVDRAGRRETKDASIVRALRDEGAVIMGKLHTAQFAFRDPPPTRNPWDLSRTPGGSSSGSAAAVAARMCFGSIGTQTGGSLLRPAAFCGMAACKPTLGVLSMEGVLPVAPELDHLGVIAADVEGVIRMLDVAMNGTCLLERIDALGAGAPPRIGFMTGFFLADAQPVLAAHLRETAQRLRAAGATITELSPPRGLEGASALNLRIIAARCAQQHGAAVATHPEAYGPRIREIVAEGRHVGSREVREALAERERLRQDVVNVLEPHDVLVTLVAPTTAPAVREGTGSSAFITPFTFVGLPSATVPTGLGPGGLPIGIQLIGKLGEEAALLAAAKWCEQRLGRANFPPNNVSKAGSA